MTNEEAIKLLSQIRDALLASNSWLPSTHNPIKESFGMAINALKKEAWKEEHPISPLLQKPALTAQPETHEKRTETHACDCIDRQAVLKAINNMVKECDSVYVTSALRNLEVIVADLPSVQPQRTCVNCGRTANNGGWYADGKTRCPIEEHYALPKDGYCHLWEKRNVTDDDYPERQKNEQV